MSAEKTDSLPSQPLEVSQQVLDKVARLGARLDAALSWTEEDREYVRQRVAKILGKPQADTQ